MIKIKNGPLYQWDLNRVLEIIDPENKIFEVECYSDDATDAVLLPFSRKGDKVETFFPNIFLQNPQNIHILAVFKDNDEVRTVEHKIFNVRSRIKPSDYVYEETEILKYKDLETEFRKALANKADLDENGKIKAEQLPGFNIGGDVDLTEAINEAIADAIENGDLKGDDGTSVWVDSVSESVQDGGNNFVYFSDGTTLKIKNGSKGSDGTSVAVDTISESVQDGGNNFVYFSDGTTLKVKNGSKGSDGAKGTDGTSVMVDSVSESAQDGGNNFVYFSDGTSVKIKNGSKGDTGEKGTDGYTPQKGIDYFTAEDKAEMIESVIEAFGANPIFGYVGSNNDIVIKGNFADGSYSVKYEMTDGSTVNIGNLVLDTNVYYSVTNNLTNCTNSNSAKQVVEGSRYLAAISANSGYELSSVSVTMGGSPVTVTNGVIDITSVTGNIVIVAVATEKSVNLLPNATKADGTPYVGTNGEKGYKSGYYLNKDTGAEVSLSGAYCTGFMSAKYTDKIYIKGITLHSNEARNGIVFFNANHERIYNAYIAMSGLAWLTYTDGVFCATLNQISSSLSNAAYFRMYCGGITDETIITVNSPIE